MPSRRALRRIAAPGDIAGDTSGDTAGDGGATSMPDAVARGKHLPLEQTLAPAAAGKKAEAEATIGVTGDHGEAGAVDGARGEPSCEQRIGDNSCTLAPKCTRRPAFGVGNSRQGAPLACTTARLASIVCGSGAVTAEAMVKNRFALANWADLATKS